MIKHNNVSLSIAWVAEIPRILLGLILLATGLGKGLDVAGFVTVLEAYQLFPPWLSLTLAYGLPVLELTIAMGLLCHYETVLAAIMAIGLHVLMLGVVLRTLYAGIQIENCGCFGVFLARPLTFGTVVEDTVMLILSVCVWLQARGRSKQFET